MIPDPTSAPAAATRGPETAGERPWAWCVADGANPDRRYSHLGPNDFPPEFGPFETRAEADEFAAMRPAYYVTPTSRPQVQP